MILMGRETNLAKWMLSILFAIGLVFGYESVAGPVVHAQNTSGITSPSAGSSISGDVPVMGSAAIDPFQKYELYYKLEPSGDDAYIYFTGGTSPVVNGQLGTLNAAAFGPGIYTLRLRVVKLDGNYAEYFTPNLSINQGPAEPEATPTSDQPTPTPIPTATFTPAPQPTPAVGAVAQPELDAPMVPSPTPTSATDESLAILVDPVQPSPGNSEAINVSPEEEVSGSLSRELGEALSLDRLSEQFYRGVRLSASIFFIIILFYVTKALVRWVRSRQ
jgi:hypothetical protein